jgi:hypothetical protein
MRGLPGPYMMVRGLLLLGHQAHTSAQPSAMQGHVAELAPIAALRQHLAPQFKRYDEAAKQAGSAYRSAFVSIYLLSALAVALAVIPLALHSNSLAYALAELSAIVLIVVLYALGRTRKWRGSWVAQRSVAEQLRYLPLLAPWASEQASPYEFTERSLSQVRLHAPPEVVLCFRTLKAAPEISVAGLVRSSPVLARSYAAYLEFVLIEQACYHQRITQLEHALAHRVHRLGGIFFVMSAAAVIGHVMGLHHWALPVLATVLPALASALHGILAQGESVRLANRSRQQASALRCHADALAKLQRGSDERLLAELQPHVAHALHTLLGEHMEWLELVSLHELPLT